MMQIFDPTFVQYLEAGYVYQLYTLAGVDKQIVLLQHQINTFVRGYKGQLISLTVRLFS